MGLEGLGGRGPAFFAPAGGGPIKEDFNSNATAVDIRVGERHPGGRRSNSTAVGEILILDADGNLTVHDELDDSPACEQITAAAIEPARRETRPGLARPGQSARRSLGRAAGSRRSSRHAQSRRADQEQVTLT